MCFSFFSFSINFFHFSASETVLISNNRHSIDRIVLELIDRKKYFDDEKNNIEKWSTTTTTTTTQQRQQRFYDNPDKRINFLSNQKNQQQRFSDFISDETITISQKSSDATKENEIPIKIEINRVRTKLTSVWQGKDWRSLKAFSKFGSSWM